MRTLFVLSLCLLFVTSIFAQDIVWKQGVKANISIQEIEKNKDEIHFSVYLNTTKDSQFDIMLDNADFVLTFNQDAFNNPVLSKATEHANTFVSTDLTDPTQSITKLNVQKFYTDALNTNVVDDKIVINLSGRAPGNNLVMTTNIARIDSDVATHCLGRFKVSGLTGSIEDAKMQWNISNKGLSTQIFSVNELTAESAPVEIVDAIVYPYGDEHQPQLQVSTMTLAPNPTLNSTQVFVNAEMAKSSMITVLDVNGKLVQQRLLELTEGMNKIDVDLQDIPAGTYFINIGEETGKLIKL